jgi:aspartate/glutamate racemase
MINKAPQQPVSLPGNLSTVDSLRLFSDYLRVTGVAHTDPEQTGDQRLIGKRLGLLNGSSWITLWANYFGRTFLPGVHLINAGNEAVQINFMEAYAAGNPQLPEENLLAFQRYAVDLVELGHVDAVLITCSTLNRAYPQVQKSLQAYNIPVFQIDRPMMERGVEQGGRILILATHGPTVDSTLALIREVAKERNCEVPLTGVLVEEAWRSLSRGDIEGHNKHLANTIWEHMKTEEITCVILAQLSMSVFLLSHPDPKSEFGVPVYTSGQCGFEAIREVLAGMN